MLAHSFPYYRFGYFSHDLVARFIGVHAVFGVF